MLLGYELVLRWSDLPHHVLIAVEASHDLLARLLQILSIHVILRLHSRRPLHEIVITGQHLRNLSLESLVVELGPLADFLLVGRAWHGWVDLSKALCLPLKHTFFVDGTVVVLALNRASTFELLHQELVVVVVVLRVLIVLLEVGACNWLTKLVKSWLLGLLTSLHLAVRTVDVLLLEHSVLRLLLLCVSDSTLS